MSDCIEWEGTRSNGYGVAVVGGKRYPAHRLAFMEAHGLAVIPAGMGVLHSCDNPGCVNPDHLKLGDQAQNVREAVERERWPSKAGENNGRARLSEQDVLEIRERYARGEKRAEIARRFGLFPTTVNAIATGRRWSHVPLG